MRLRRFGNNVTPGGPPEGLGRQFPEESTIRTGEPPEIPEAQPEGDLGDGGLIRATRHEKLPGLMQAADTNPFDG